MNTRRLLTLLFGILLTCGLPLTAQADVQRPGDVTVTASSEEDVDCADCPGGKGTMICYQVQMAANSVNDKAKDFHVRVNEATGVNFKCFTADRTVPLTLNSGWNSGHTNVVEGKVNTHYIGWFSDSSNLEFSKGETWEFCVVYCGPTNKLDNTVEWILTNDGDLWPAEPDAEGYRADVPDVYDYDPDNTLIDDPGWYGTETAAAGSKVGFMVCNVAIGDESAFNGQDVMVSVTWDDNLTEIAGFDLLIDYDQTALSFLGATRGALLDSLEWEYFTYRTGARGNCPGGCPDGLVRLVAIADLDNGPEQHPITSTAPGILANLNFHVSSDRNLIHQCVPISFYWADCGDNTFASISGDTTYLDRKIYGPTGNLLWDEDDDDEFPDDARPQGLGAPDVCLEGAGPDNPEPLRIFTFCNGWVCIDEPPGPYIWTFLSNGWPGCEYNAPQNGSVTETLTIQNLGTAALSGSVASAGGAPWLIMATGAYTINPGDPNDTRSVTMDATGLAEGLYQETIWITHNDTTKVSPKDIAVDFFVFNDFACAEDLVLNTGWLWLEVGNTERFANQNDDRGGLARLDPATGDTSWSIYDGSLVIARPLSFDPDTLVYRNIFGAGNGQPGFRALSSLIIDTTAYGYFTGAATASAEQTTVDSLLGVDVTYIFPQDPDSCEFVLVQYKIYNRDATDATGLVIGMAADFDVIPGFDIGTQIGAQNSGHILFNYNAVYQRGADTTGHVIVGDLTAARYEGGMTVIQCDPAPRGWIAPSDPYLFGSTGGGFSDSYLYDNLTGSGFELFPPNDPNPEEDLHSVIAFEQGVNLTADAGNIKYYVVGLVSSNTGPADDATDLTNTIKHAWKYCFGWSEVVDYATVREGSSNSWAYHAIGSHEDGLGGGCCGCIVTMVSGDSRFSVTPDGDQCTGTINFDGIDGGCDNTASATFRVTDLCGGYIDDCVVEVLEEGCPCQCPNQGDMNLPTANGFIDSVDLGLQIDAIFFGGTDRHDPGCPTSSGDFNANGFTDSIDLGFMIDHIFFGGNGPTDPCSL